MENLPKPFCEYLLKKLSKVQFKGLSRRAYLRGRWALIKRLNLQPWQGYVPYIRITRRLYGRKMD